MTKEEPKKITRNRSVTSYSGIHGYLREKFPKKGRCIFCGTSRTNCV